MLLKKVLERWMFKWNRFAVLSFCLSVGFFPKPVPTFGSDALVPRAPFSSRIGTAAFQKVADPMQDLDGDAPRQGRGRGQHLKDGFFLAQGFGIFLLKHG